MNVRTVLSRFLADDEPHVVTECRRCGTTVVPETDTCPECDAAEIARYEIPG